MKKTATKLLLLLSAVTLSGQLAKGQAFDQGFEDIYDLPGWDMINMSNPTGIENWVQGYSTQANQTYYFIANSGTDTSFICGSFQNTAGAGTISNWLLTPAVTLANGDTLSFWTRSTDLAGTVYPDRMQVFHSLVNSSNVGADEFSVGDFTEGLLDINAAYDATTTNGYPMVWTQYSVTVSTVPTPVTGRFAFRYFVEDGGPSGANSFIIGIDDVSFTPGTVGIKSNGKPAIGVSTYPNPATDRITIDLATALPSQANIVVTNELGKAVMNGVMNKATKAQIVDISKLAGGTYYICITDADGNFYRAHFAKN